MNPTEYQCAAMRTKMAHPTPRDALAYAGLKLSGEAGELLETMFASHPATRADKIKELGDVCWYIALITDAAGFDPVRVWTDYEPIAAFTWYNAAIRLSVYASATSEAIGKLWHGRAESTITAPLSRTVAAVHACADVLGLDVADIWAANIAKLQHRYPHGFTTAASVDRSDSVRTPAKSGDGG